MPIGGFSAGDMLGTGVRSRVRMGGHAAISDGSLAASEAGGISGSGVGRALALFGRNQARGGLIGSVERTGGEPRLRHPAGWRSKAPSSAQSSSLVCTGGGSGMGGAPPIRAHLTGHRRLAAQPAPREAASIRARACSTPGAPHRAPANVMLRPRLPPDVGPATGGWRHEPGTARAVGWSAGQPRSRGILVAATPRPLPG